VLLPFTQVKICKKNLNGILKKLLVMYLER